MRNDVVISYVSINGSSYSLLQYLLMHDVDTCREHTFYFLGDGIDKSVRDRLEHMAYFPTKPVKGWESMLRLLTKLKLRWFGNGLYPFVKHAKIYAQDYLYPAILIGGSNYSLLQESPYHLTVNANVSCADYQRRIQKRKSLKGKIEKWLYGNVLINDLGENPQCDTIYLTEENVSPVLEGKKVIIRSLTSMWEESSKDKKQYIKHVFGIDETYNNNFQQTCMFLTQPLVDDAILTEKEYVDYLQKIFSHYDIHDMIIKVHPRDTFDYQKHFSQIAIYDKKINLELMVILGLNIKKIISICSTAVNGVPENITIDWLGADSHPKIEQRLGNSIIPFRTYCQITL